MMVHSWDATILLDTLYYEKLNFLHNRIIVKQVQEEIDDFINIFHNIQVPLQKEHCTKRCINTCEYGKEIMLHISSKF